MLFKSRLFNLINSTRFFIRPAVEITYQETGNPIEVLRLSTKKLEVDKLENKKVFVKWLASPINPADITQIQGKYPIKPTLPAVGGNEGCAQVLKVGSDVDDIKENDLVIPSESGIGTWCSYGIYESKQLLPINGNIKDIIFLSMLQVNPSTAYRMLKDFVTLSPGDLVIQNGANSSVGHFVIQLCRIFGVKTINIVRDRPEIDQLKNQLKEIGADEVYTEDELADILYNKKFKAKLALNCIGGRSGMNIARALESGGTIVTYGGMSNAPVQLTTSSLIFFNIKSFGFWMTNWAKYKQNKEKRTEMYKELINLYKDGAITLPNYQKRNYSEYKEAIEQSTQTEPSSKIKQKQIFTRPDEDNINEYNNYKSKNKFFGGRKDHQKGNHGEKRNIGERGNFTEFKEVMKDMKEKMN